LSHLSNEQMSGYARRTLDAEALLLADDHLSCCDECRNRLIDVEGLKETVDSLRQDLRTALDAPTGHLPYDQIEARAEGRLRGAAREVAETHIEHCAACARQARDLEAFAAAFRARVQEHAAASSAAAAPASAAAAPPAPATAVATPARAASPPTRVSARPTSADLDAAAHRPAPSAEVSADAVKALGASVAPARSRLWPVFLGLLTTIVVATAFLGTPSLRDRIDALTRSAEDPGRRDDDVAAQAAQTAQAAQDAAPRGGVEERDLASPSPVEDAPPQEAPPPVAAAVLPPVETPQAAPQQAAPLQQPGPPAGAAPEPAAPPAGALQDQRGMVGLDGNGNLLGLDGVPPGESQAIAAALQHGSLEMPADLKTLSTIPKFIQIDDNAAGMPLVNGAATYVRTTRPTLAWQPVEGAQVYTIVLFNQQGRPLYYGGPTAETSWTPPAPLQRGVTYTWRVGAYRPSGAAAAARGGAGATPPASEKLAGAASRFKVIDAVSAASLERALRATPGSRVAAGVLYARAGLLDDAGREFRGLLAQNPDSGLAKALLASIEAARLP
jgi:hypothetical protein